MRNKNNKLSNKICYNFAMSGLCFMGISILGRILIHSIEFILSIPFIFSENSTYRVMDNVAGFLGNIIFVLGIVLASLFFTKGLYLSKKYRCATKNNKKEAY